MECINKTIKIKQFPDVLGDLRNMLMRNDNL